MNRIIAASLVRFVRDEAGTSSVAGMLWIPPLILFFMVIFDATYVFMRDSEVRRVVYEGNRQFVRLYHGVDHATASSSLETWLETELDKIAPSADATVTVDANGVLVTNVQYQAGDTAITGLIGPLNRATITVVAVHQTEI